MGGKGGHMLHPYEDPELTFQDLINMFEHTAMGGLEGTIKRDGQNLVVSYSLARDEAVAIRNDDQVYAKGMGLKGDGAQENFADYLSTKDPRFKSFRKGRPRNKKATPPHIVKAFSKALRDLEAVARELPEEVVIDLFGEDADFFYNAEVMSPLSRNAIEYGVDTLSIHRILHHKYDEEERDLDTMGAVESGKRADVLDQALKDYYSATREGDDPRDPTPVSVGAMERLAALEDESVKEQAIQDVKAFASSNGLSLKDSIGRLVFVRFREGVHRALPHIGPDAEKMLVIRMFQEVYNAPGHSWDAEEVLEDFGDRSISEGKVALKDIALASADREKETLAKIKEMANSAKRFHARIITPLVNIIFRFSAHALGTLEDMYVLNRDAEIERTRAAVLKTIDNLETLLKPVDPNDPKAAEKWEKFIAQRDKFKSLEDKISEAEGFVFQWPPGSDNTYKFTGLFAPINQLLGMDPSRWTEGIEEGLKDWGFEKAVNIVKNHVAKQFPKLSNTLKITEASSDEIALYPGKFKPPHGGHFNVAKAVLETPGINKLVIFVSPKEHEGITSQQAVNIWNVYRNYLPGDVDIRVADITPVRSVYDYIDNEAETGESLHLILGEKDVAGGRFKTASDRRPEVQVSEVPIPPQMGGVSATQMRRALRDNDDKTFIAGLPEELNDADVSDIMTALGTSLDEISTGVGMVGAPGGFGYVDRAPETVGSERRCKKKPCKDFLKEEEEIVTEVLDYLLGITVG
tara:strand:- start:445 stop:2688 length:2244 start_codon:yes stop_codon:yes gene_type:complete